MEPGEDVEPGRRPEGLLLFPLKHFPPGNHEHRRERTTGAKAVKVGIIGNRQIPGDLVL